MRLRAGVGVEATGTLAANARCDDWPTDTLTHVADRRVLCLDCGAELEPTLPAGTTRPPCDRFGSRRINAQQSPHVTVGISTSVRGVARSQNHAAARLHALRAAIDEVKAAADARDVGRAQRAVKQALEPIHELDDCRRNRGEWSNSSWTPSELGVWEALIGARNAAHHFSSHVVQSVGGSNHTPSRDDLRWEDSLPPIDSAARASEYASRLAGEAVLPTLRDVSAVLSRSIA